MNQSTMQLETRAANGDFCSCSNEGGGETIPCLPCCFVRACVAAAGQRWRYPSTYRRRVQLVAPGTPRRRAYRLRTNERNFRHREFACMRAESIVGSPFSDLFFPRRVGGKRRGAFLAFSCQVGQHCILRVIKVPCKSPETARLAMGLHPCALAGCCDDNQAAL